MLKNKLIIIGSLIVASCIICGLMGYARYVDWPSIGGENQIRKYLPEEFPIRDAHHYTYRNFMDTWELYRFSTSPAAIEYLKELLNLGSPVTVNEFPLIVSRPPPYWWHPERVPKALLYQSESRATDGLHYELLYSENLGIAYMIKFDG